MDGSDVRRLRGALGLSQQAFASLLGLSFVTVNRWEGGRAVPHRLGRVLLQLLDGAMGIHPTGRVLEHLLAAGPEPLALVRALVRLESGKLPT